MVSPFDEIMCVMRFDIIKSCCGPCVRSPQLDGYIHIAFFLRLHVNCGYMKRFINLYPPARRRCTKLVEWLNKPRPIGAHGETHGPLWAPRFCGEPGRLSVGRAAKSGGPWAPMGFVTFQSILVHHPAPPKIIGPTLYEPPHLQTPRGRRRICQAHSHCSAVFGSLESFSRLGFCICCNPCQKTYFQTPLRNILRKMETVKNKFMQTGSCQKIFCEK